MLTSLSWVGTNMDMDGLMTFYISKYNSYLTEYEHNKEETQK